MSSSPAAAAGDAGQRPLDLAVDRVREALAGLSFGTVSITVHDGRVVQIDVTEKRRLAPH